MGGKTRYKTYPVSSVYNVYHYSYLMEVRVWCYVGYTKNIRSQDKILPETL